MNEKEIEEYKQRVEKKSGTLGMSSAKYHVHVVHNVGLNFESDSRTHLVKMSPT